jgi:anti-sigma regulatory factor (Ser/Thr protein kinase)
LTRGAESDVDGRCVCRRHRGPFPAGAGGEGGGIVGGTGVRGSVTIEALAGQVGVARAVVGGVLGVGHPCLDAAVLLVSELVTNSVLHSGSTVAGGQVTVTVSADGGVARVAVAERAGPGVPVLVPDAGGEAEGNRGMRLVDMLASRWGYERGGGQAVTWFELCST